MANWKKVDADKLDADLTSVADAIRERTGTTEELDFPGGFVSAVENIQDYRGLFDGSSTEITVPNGITNLRNSAFKAMKILKTVHLPEGLTVIDNAAFWDCYALTRIQLPTTVKSLPAQVFAYCGVLQVVDGYVTEFSGTQCLMGCWSCGTVILRDAETVCTLANTNNFQGTPIEKGTGYVYVPRALVDSYKAATNWSTYASQIRAIEDWPDKVGG